MVGLPVGEESVFTHFNTIHESQRRTDSRSDGQITHSTVGGLA